MWDGSRILSRIAWIRIPGMNSATISSRLGRRGFLEDVLRDLAGACSAFDCIMALTSSSEWCELQVLR